MLTVPYFLLIFKRLCAGDVNTTSPKEALKKGRLVNVYSTTTHHWESLFVGFLWAERVDVCVRISSIK